MKYHATMARMIAMIRLRSMDIFRRRQHGKRRTENKIAYLVIMQSPHSDTQYSDIMRDQSTWPGIYTLTQTQPTDAHHGILGLNAPGVAGGSIDVYNMIGVFPPSRTLRLKSEQEINTELYGTAPYLGSGDGIMFNVEKSTQMRDSIPELRGARSRHWIDDRSYNRWDFVSAHNATQAVSDQYGAQGRAEIAYSPSA